MTENQNTRAALFMLLSMLSFSIGDTSIKAIGEDMPLSQLLVLRGVMACAFFFWLARRKGHLKFDIGGRNWRLLGVRSLAETCAAWMFLTALIHMPLANANAIMQSIPLVVTLGATLFLKEHIGPRRWIAISIGFLGMLLIVRPGTDGFNIYALCALGAVLSVSARDLATRGLTEQVPSLLVSFLGSSAVLLFAVVLSATDNWVPVTPWLAAMVLLQTVAIIAAYHFSVQTMRMGQAGFTAPFRYASLVFALVFGLVFFDHWPDALTMCGAMIIVGTGLYVMWRERKLA